VLPNIGILAASPLAGAPKRAAKIKAVKTGFLRASLFNDALEIKR
jgi:hypothetical protein